MTALMHVLHQSRGAQLSVALMHALHHSRVAQLIVVLMYLAYCRDVFRGCDLQAASETAQAVSTALEAACCCMQVLSATSMHNSLYIDELMTATVSLAKYQLQYNVLALHDPQYKRLYRPGLAAPQGAHTTAGSGLIAALKHRQLQCVFGVCGSNHWHGEP